MSDSTFNLEAGSTYSFSPDDGDTSQLVIFIRYDALTREYVFKDFLDNEIRIPRYDLQSEIKPLS